MDLDWFGNGRQFYGYFCGLGTCLPVWPKITPDLVETIDRFPLASDPVTQKTTLMEVVIEECWEVPQFNFISSPRFTLILGAPWIIHHDTQILWSQLAISFPSSFYRKNLDPWKPNPLWESRYSPKWHVKYSLPLYCVYVFPIDLQLRATVPFWCIYPMSKPELAEYPQENLDKGLILCSTSSAGAPILCKKEGWLYETVRGLQGMQSHSHMQLVPLTASLGVFRSNMVGLAVHQAVL